VAYRLSHLVNTKILPKLICSRVFGPLHVDAAGLGVQSDRTGGEDVADTGGLRVAGGDRNTKQPAGRRVVGQPRMFHPAVLDEASSTPSQSFGCKTYALAGCSRLVSSLVMPLRNVVSRPATHPTGGGSHRQMPWHICAQSF
jgi:hypothetical protein